MKKSWKEMKTGDHIWIIDSGTSLPDGYAIIRGTLTSDYAEQNDLGLEDGFKFKVENMGPGFKWKPDCFSDSLPMFWSVTSDDAGNERHFNDYSEAVKALIKLLTPKLNVYADNARLNIEKYKALLERIQKLAAEND